MDKKITRRAVLGTTIAALVAGPFVIRALRRGRREMFSFDSYWRECFAKSRFTRGEVVPVSEPTTLDCRFDMCREVSYWGMHASFDGNVESVSAETLPWRFSEKVVCYSGLGDGKLQCRDAVVTGYEGLVKEEKEVPPHSVYVGNDGKLLAVKQGDSPQTALPNFDIPIAILDVLGTGLVFRPQMKVLTVGDTWVVPAGGFCECEVTCRILGYEKVLERIYICFGNIFLYPACWR